MRGRWLGDAWEASCPKYSKSFQGGLGEGWATVSRTSIPPLAATRPSTSRMTETLMRDAYRIMRPVQGRAEHQRRAARRRRSWNLERMPANTSLDPARLRLPYWVSQLAVE
jgi:hypothetical protein